MAKIRNGIDPLHPFVNAGSNRIEVFYIEFDGFLCNRAMNMLTNLLMVTNPESNNWYERYPFINSFIGMKSDDLYHITKLYNPYEFLCEIAASDEDTNRSEEEIISDIRILESIGYVKYQQVTSFAFALNKMLKENCISKVYIQKEYNFYDWEKLFIKELLDPYLDKIELLEGPSFHALNEVKNEVTTAFINFPQMLDTIHDEFDKELYEKQLYLVRANRNTLFYNKDTEKMEYINPNFTEDNKKRGIKTGIIYTESINEDPLNEIIVAG